MTTGEDPTVCGCDWHWLAQRRKSLLLSVSSFDPTALGFRPLHQHHFVIWLTAVLSIDDMTVGKIDTSDVTEIIVNCL